MKPTDDNILRLLLPSFAGIAVCVLCLAGLTWAWFSVSVAAKPQSLIAANFDVAVEITDISSDAPIAPEDSGYYALSAGVYRITLNRAGTSAESAGYCLIKIGDAEYPSVPLVLNDPLTFTLALDTEKAVGFMPVWGTRDGEPVKDGDTITITEQDQTTEAPPVSSTEENESEQTMPEPSTEPTEASGTESTAASEATTTAGTEASPTEEAPSAATTPAEASASPGTGTATVSTQEDAPAA